MRGAAFQLFKTVRAIPGAAWATMAIFAFVWGVWAFAAHTGAEAEKAKTYIARIEDEVKVGKTQGRVSDLAIKRLDEKIVYDRRIDERTDDARRALKANAAPVSGDHFADRLAALRVYRAVSVGLRNEILADRERFIAGETIGDVPRPMRSSRPAYG